MSARDEVTFQRELADWIKRCPAGDPESDAAIGLAYEEWHSGFEAWCFRDCSPEQHDRALALYELHVANEAAR